MGALQMPLLPSDGAYTLLFYVAPTCLGFSNPACPQSAEVAGGQCQPPEPETVLSQPTLSFLLPCAPNLGASGGSGATVADGLHSWDGTLKGNPDREAHEGSPASC